VLSVVMARELRFWRYSGHDPLDHTLTTQRLGSLIQNSGHADSLPVVISDGVLFGQLSFYSDRSWSNRLFWLADADRELKYDGTDSMNKNMLGLRELLPHPEQVRDYSEFTASHESFLVYADDLKWVDQALIGDSALVQLVVAEGSHKLYFVRMNP